MEDLEKEQEELTYDDAFSADEADDTTEVNAEEQETAPEITEPKPDEPEVEPVAETPAEPSWKDLGLDRYEGLTKEQIAREIKWINKQYGDHTHEVGELRKKIAELESKTETKVVEEKPEPRRGLTAAEVEDYNTLYEKDPVGAFIKYGESDIQRIIDKRVEEKLQTILPDKLGKITDEQADAMEFENFNSRHDDAEEYISSMKILDDPKYLGTQKRKYDELYELVKLSETDDTQYQQVYALMKKHPTMSYKEAVSFTGSKITPKTTRQQVVKEVEKIKQVNSASTAKANSKQGAIALDLDDAFNIK